MNYRVNLVPDEYIKKRRFWFSGSPAALFSLAALFIIILIYCYFRISTYNLCKEINIYSQSAGKTGITVQRAGEIQREREKYQGRFAVINTLTGRAITTAGIAETLFKAFPAGTMLTSMEITFFGGEEINSSRTGKVIIEGELPSVELVGIYLSDIQGLPVIKDALAKDVKCAGDRTVFTINAEIDMMGAKK